MMRSAAIAGLLYAAGCGVEVEFLTEAPPTKAAEVGGGEIVISPGVAVVAHCIDACSGNCEAPRMTTRAPGTLGVRVVAPVPQPTATDGPIDDPLFLLIGRSRGTTRLLVQSECGSTEYGVTVQ